MLHSRMLAFSVFCAVVLVFTIVPAQGEDTYWQHDSATPGDWFDPSNWTAGVPGNTDYAYIDNGGTAVIAGGDGQSEQLLLGSSNIGSVLQTGGSNTIGWILNIGYESGSQGTYELSGSGQVTAWIERIGWSGTGTFLQSGGTNTVSYNLRLGSWSGSQGTYEISGGVLETSDFYIGWNGSGILNITGAGADITVSGLLNFGSNGSLAAVPGATIHMTGSAFQNESTNSASLAGLGNLKMIFEGGTEDVDPFEAAGEDVGAVVGGFVTDNFLLDTLQLGGTAAGKIQLVDDFDNQADGSGVGEAVYVNNLIMNAGATIDTNGLNLYYLNGGAPKQFFCGDATLDGYVDGSDLDILLADWGKGVPPANHRADLSGDFYVDGDDLDLILSDWGKSVPSGGESTPEPTTLLLLCGAAVPILLKRRRKQ